MPRPSRSAALFAVLLLMLQVWLPVQATAAMAAMAAERFAAESLCLHDEDGRPSPDAPERQHHGGFCPACVVCCIVPVALPADAGTLPAPQDHGRLRRPRSTAPRRVTGSRHRPRARGPPSPRTVPAAIDQDIDQDHPAGHDAGRRGDFP